MSSTAEVRWQLEGGNGFPRPTPSADRTPLGLRAVRLLREELQLLQEPGSYVGEVIKVCRRRQQVRTGSSALQWQQAAGGQQQLCPLGPPLP